MSRATFLPFLYQTRTLQRVPRNALVPSYFRALLHVGSRRQSPVRKRQCRTPDPIPFELPADLRDLQHEKADPEAESEVSARSTITPSERQAFDLIFEEIAGRYASSSSSNYSQAAPSSHTGSSGSISPNTGGEGGMIAEEGSRALLGDALQLKLDQMSESVSDSADSNGYRGVKSAINLIIEDAVDSASRSKLSTSQLDLLHPLGGASATADRAKAFLRFPPSLRRAARIALGLAEENVVLGQGGVLTRSGETDGAEAIEGGMRMQAEGDSFLSAAALTQDSLARTVQVELLRSDERTRVEASMRAATNDFALWAVLERDVFSMVERLGIGEATVPRESATQAKPRQSRRRGRDAAPPAAENHPDAADNSAGTPPLSMSIHGPLYPSYLLLALRLLDTAFAAPSTLALALLPRIKQLGLASYVLGATTPFYNELVSILWRRSGDVGAVLALFEEMRHAGHYFDVESLKLIIAIDDLLQSARKGSRGPFLQGMVVVLDVDDSIGKRVGHWRRFITRSVDQRMREAVY